MDIFTAILQITLFSLLVFSAIMLFQKLFAKFLSPLMKYLLWFLLLARLIIPFNVTTEIKLFSINEGTANTIVSTANNILENKIAFNEKSNLVDEETSFDTQAINFTPYEQRNATAVSITFGQLLLLLWICASAIIVVLQLKNLFHLKSKMKNLILLPSEYNDIVRECLKKTGIKKVRILTGYGFSSPALTISLKPQIIIPYEITCGDKQEFIFALLHELTHLKRKDNIVMLIWNLLKIVYPFNPVVWLGANAMRKDMESACDFAVTSKMTKAEKRQYAEMLLNLYSLEKPNTQLALFSVKKETAQRIKSIFSLEKTKVIFKIAVIFLSCALFMLFFTTACTPAVIAVQNAVEQKVEIVADNFDTEMPLTQPEYIKIDAPLAVMKTFELEDENGKPFTVNFDASVQYPSNIAKLPLYTAKMTTENTPVFIAIAEYFLHGKKLHDINGTETELEDLKYSETIEFIDYTPELYELFKNDKSASAENLQLINDMNLEYNLCIIKTRDIFAYNGEFFKINGGYSSNAVQEYYFYPYKKTGTKWPFSYIEYNKYHLPKPEVTDFEANISQKAYFEEGIDYHSALKIAENALDEMNFENYELTSKHCNKIYDNSNLPDVREVWRWNFIFSSVLENGVNSDINSVYVSVDEDIISFRYNNIAEIIGESENIEILPLNDTFYEKCAFAIAGYDSQNDNNIAVVDKVVLEYSSIPVKDKIDECILTPTWTFYYKTDGYYGSIGINAITGEFNKVQFP